MKNLFRPFVLLAVGVLLVALLAFWRGSSRTATAPSSGEPSPSAPPEAVRNAVPREEDAAVPPTPPEATQPAPDPEIAGPLADSPIAQRWYDESGYTREEILEAQAHLLSEGYSPEQAEDPGNVRRVLPPRHVASLMPLKVSLPSEARAGDPIGFQFEGRTPDPSFEFTRFSIIRQESVIRIRAMGRSDGLIAATAEGPGDIVSLDGEIPPLPAGQYLVEVEELGPRGSFSLTVR